MPALHAGGVKSLLLHIFIFELLYEDLHCRRNQPATTHMGYTCTLKTGLQIEEKRVIKDIHCEISKIKMQQESLLRICFLFHTVCVKEDHRDTMTCFKSN